MAIIGIDIGTSGCKVSIFDLKGKVISNSSGKYPEKRGDGIREIEPNTVREQVLTALGNAVSKCPEPIQAICVTCLGESLVCLDERDQILCNSMVTGDSRGIKETEKLSRMLNSNLIFDITGLMPNPMYTLPKLIWLHDHTDVLKKVKKIFFYEDYIGYLLTGERKVSYSTAARSCALDIHALQWNPQLLAVAELTPEYFSEPVPSGSIIGFLKRDIAEKYNMTGNIPVIAGAHDQACAGLGSGFGNASIAEDGIGTCECLALMLPPDYDESIAKKLQMPHMIYPLTPSSTFFTTVQVNTCGALMNWARDVLLGNTRLYCSSNNLEFFQYMDRQIEGKETDVLILPEFGSSGQPDFGCHGFGTICGLTLDTTEADIYLALKESMIYQLLLAYDYAKPMSLHFDKLVMTGGAASSQISAQLRANIYQKPVYTLSNNEAGTLGCMILAAVAIGAYPDIITCMKEVVHYSKVILPDSSTFSRHEERYQQYKALYKKMHAFPY